MRKVQVEIPGFEYEILLGHGTLATAAATKALRNCLSGGKCLLVTDSNVEPLYAAGAVEALKNTGCRDCFVSSFPAGEKSKTLATVSRIYDDAVACGLGRADTVAAMGGGVVGDIAGFVAATYMRGVRFVQFPTTLLAMVDSSVGGKVGVDLPAGKNLVGAFHQPALVLIDLDTLKTLPQREFACGLAEIVKYGMIMDEPFFAYLEKHADDLLGTASADIISEVVSRCCELKAQVVADDEKEQGRRAILNYGHTFGHALEVLTDFSRLNHGEGVAVGMGMAVDLAVAAGLAADDIRLRQDALLRRLGLPLNLAQLGISDLRPQNVLECMYRDKKVLKGSLRLVLPLNTGTVEVVEFTDKPAVLAAIGGRLG